MQKGGTHQIWIPYIPSKEWIMSIPPLEEKKELRNKKVNPKEKQTHPL